MRLIAFEPDIAPNLGAMIRLAVAFDVPLDIIEPCGFPFSLRALKVAALDYADKAQMHRHDSWAAFQRLRPAGRLVALSTKGATNLPDFTFHPDDQLLMGRESAGLPEAVMAQCQALIRIPTSPQVRSLNVATAAAIALYEARRQLGY